MKRWLLPLLLSPLTANAADLLFSDGFESQNCATGWTKTVDATHYTPSTSENQFETTPVQAGTYSMNYYGLVGTNEHVSIQCGMGASELSAIGITSSTDEFYQRWYMYVETGYPWATSSQKIGRWGWSSGASKKEIGIIVSNTNDFIQINTFCGLWGDTSLCNQEHFENYGPGVTENGWHQYAWWVKLNTPGQADGFQRLYIDDMETAVLDDQGINIRGNDTNGFDFMWFMGNYSMLSGSLPSSGSIFLDEFEIYNTKPDAEAGDDGGDGSGDAPVGTEPGSDAGTDGD